MAIYLARATKNFRILVLDEEIYVQVRCGNNTSLAKTNLIPLYPLLHSYVRVLRAAGSRQWRESWRVSTPKLGL